MEGGGHDNITALMIQVLGTPPPGQIMATERRASLLKNLFLFTDLSFAETLKVKETQAGEAEVLPFEQAMRVLLEQALAASGGRIYGPGGAAARLGLKPTTMQGKLKRYGVSARDPEGSSAT